MTIAGAPLQPHWETGNGLPRGERERKSGHHDSVTEFTLLTLRHAVVSRAVNTVECINRVSQPVASFPRHNKAADILARLRRFQAAK